MLRSRAGGLLWAGLALGLALGLASALAPAVAAGQESPADPTEKAGPAPDDAASATRESPAPAEAPAERPAPAAPAVDVSTGDAPPAAPEAPQEARAEDEESGADAGNPLAGLSFTSADEPIVVEADRMEFHYEQNRLIYKGSVHVVQGDLELTSKTLTVTFDRADELERAQLNRVVAHGDVEIVQGERRATGERAVFDQASRQLILKGDPVVRDGPNEVQGDQLTVYLDEGRSVVESSPKKRVSAVLFPGDAGDDEGGGPPPEVVPPEAAAEASEGGGR